MNQERTERLLRDFPELFRGYTKPMTETSMCFGFECGDGWFELLRELSAAIMAVCQSEGIDVPEVMQVKEKFGGLRYYIDGGNEAIYRLIEAGEARSFAICEDCGAPGERRSVFGWISTLCAVHYEAQLKDR